MKIYTPEMVTAAVQKNERSKRAGTPVAPYCDHEIDLLTYRPAECGSSRDEQRIAGTMRAIRAERRAFNRAFRAARARLAELEKTT